MAYDYKLILLEILFSQFSLSDLLEHQKARIFWYFQNFQEV